MDLYSGYINKLIDELSGLPGIGSKSAQRLAFHLIGLPEAKVNRIANAMIQARQNVRYCKECFTLTDNELCPICANAERDHSTIMVVENSRDLAAYEKTGKYKGVYHVLHGAISPMLGVGPHDIKLKELMERLSREPEVKEVIIATNSSLEGETTAMYIGISIAPLIGAAALPYGFAVLLAAAAGSILIALLASELGHFREPREIRSGSAAPGELPPTELGCSPARVR